MGTEATNAPALSDLLAEMREFARGESGHDFSANNNTISRWADRIEQALAATPPCAEVDDEDETDLIESLLELKQEPFNAECCNSSFPIRMLRRVCDEAIKELRRLSTAPATPPEGFVMVPVEPTDDMVWAGKTALAAEQKVKDRLISPMTMAYKAALAAAAPTPPKREG